MLTLDFEFFLFNKVELIFLHKNQIFIKISFNEI